MRRSLAILAVIAASVAACSGASTAELSNRSTGFSLGPIAELITREDAGITCGSPGGGGGYVGPGPHGEPLAHHHASLSCEYTGGTIDRLAAAWERASASYIESRGVTIADPGSFSSDDVRGLTWEFTSGAATGVLTLSIVPLGGDSYRVMANLVEYAPIR